MRLNNNLPHMIRSPLRILFYLFAGWIIIRFVSNSGAMLLPPDINKILNLQADSFTLIEESGERSHFTRMPALKNESEAEEKNSADERGTEKREGEDGRAGGG
ncbi:hypothetical protein V8J88_12375 [Massilia sp. W12]|uniref:hypothetical protein n=1 Tax=Massilia sp. W12 TaxID=3126507 RepID=UPI0030D3B047